MTEIDIASSSCMMQTPGGGVSSSSSSSSSIPMAAATAAATGTSSSATTMGGDGGGRAVSESVGSLLSSLRHRLTRSSNNLINQPDETTTRNSNSPNAETATTRTASLSSVTSPTGRSTAATSGVATSASTSTTTRLFMARLESAELAHANHIPLGLLPQEMERRSQRSIIGNSTHNSDKSLSSSSSLPYIPGAAPATAVAAATIVPPLGRPKRGDSFDSNLPGATRDDDNDDDTESIWSTSSAGRRRRTSILMASRNRDEVLQRPAVDRQLHSLGGFEAVLLPTLSEDVVSAERHMDSPINASLQEQQQPERFQLRDDKLDPMDIDGQQHTGDDNMTLLLTEKRRDRSEDSSRYISFMEKNQTALEEPTEEEEQQQQPMAPSSNTVVYSWGTDGTHSLHDTVTTRTKAVDSKIVEGRVTRHTLLQVSIGPRHTAAVTTTGQVLICGNNSQAQVDPASRCCAGGDDEDASGSSTGNTITIPKPRLLEFPSSMTRITQVSCGRSHTAAITTGGTVLTWGDNAFGQLGHRRNKKTTGTAGDGNGNYYYAAAIPTMMVGVIRAAQVSCGFDFTAVLTTRMQLWICGTEEVVTWTNEIDNSNNENNNTATPEPPLPATVPSLEGLPLVKVVAGARHVLVLTAFGTAYAWGANEEGCCSRAFPKTIHTPVPIVFTADNMDTDGDDVVEQGRGGGPHDKPEHSDILSPFPHWNRKSPNEPLLLDPNVAIDDAACGEAFTLFLTKRGQVYVCGSNGQGQLGLEAPSVLTTTLLPTTNHGSNNITAVAAGQFHSLLLDDNGDVWSMGLHQKPHLSLENQGIQKIFAGGLESVAIAPAMHPAGSKIRNRIQREFSLRKESDDGVEVMLTDREESGDAGSSAYGDMFVVERLMAQQDKGQLMKQINDFFSTPTIWNSCFLDPSECDDLYQQLLSRRTENGGDGDEHISTTVAISKAMQQAMLQGLENLRSTSARLLYPESVRFLLLFLQCPLFVDNKIGGDGGQDPYEFDVRGDLALSLCETFLSLPFEGYKAIQQWSASAYGPMYFSKFLLRPLIGMLERGLVDGGGAKSRAVPGIVTLLRWFHGVRERNPSLASPTDFHSDAIADMNPETLYEDLKKWKDGGKRTGTYFLSAHPFLLSPRTKRTLLMIENQVEMLKAATSNLSWDRVQHHFVFDPYFVLAVDRHNLVPQTLQRISAASHLELRKSLKIVFKGEDAVDAGGVTKEFFHLLSNQLFDMNTGMWSSQYGESITWFNGDCTWNDDGYYLVGVLTGLAVYNDVILDVNYPRAVFRKLLGYTLGIEDMVDEETKKGMQQLLAFDGDDVEDVFCLSFEHTWMDLGMERRVELKPGGAEIPVTSDNKEEYVMLYVKWLLVDSIKAQYDNFERGVMQVLESSSLDLLEPDELELLLVGTPELDIDAWQNNASYEGFEADSPVIQNFWKFVRQADRETKLLLLKFTTGASRAPIGGLGVMPFKIQRAGQDSMQLSTSHTCFNILILRKFSSVLVVGDFLFVCGFDCVCLCWLLSSI